MRTINPGCSIDRRMLRLAIGLLAMLAPCLFGACSSPPVKQPQVPAFNYAALTTTLQKGVSGPADVKAALGEPNGSGGYLFPVVAGPDKIWFYEKTKIDISGGELDFQQDMLLIFFKEGRFDGFMWYSDAHKQW